MRVQAVLLISLLLPSCGERDEGPVREAGPEAGIIALLAKDKPDEAAELLSRISSGKEDAYWVHYCRGRIAFLRAEQAGGDGAVALVAEAQAEFEKALEASSADYMARTFLGKTQGARGELVSAIKNLELAVKLEPHEGDAYFELGRVYVLSGEVDAAMEIINQGLDQAPDRADGYMLYGEIVFNYRKLYDEGLVSMRKALALDAGLRGGKRKLADYLLTLASRIIGNQDYAGTMQLVEEALELFPGEPGALKLRAQVHAQTEQSEKAIEDLRKCRDVAPDDEEVKTLLSRLMIQKGYQLLFLKRRDEALGLFREAIALEARDVDTSVVARILADDEVETQPVPEQDARAFFEQACALLEAGHPDQALVKVRKSLEVLPDNPFALHQAGLALDLLGRTEEAVAELEHALKMGEKLNVKMPFTYLKLAEIAIRRELYDEGEKLLDRYAVLFPDQVSNPMAVGLRRRLLLK